MGNQPPVSSTSSAFYTDDDNYTNTTSSSNSVSASHSSNSVTISNASSCYNSVDPTVSNIPTTNKVHLDGNTYGLGINTMVGMLNEIQKNYDDVKTMTNKTIPAKITTKTDNKIAFVSDNHYIDKISDLFIYRKQLGSGASCRVLLVECKNTKQLYALKEMKMKKKLNKSLFINEYTILNRLKHKNIINYVDSWIDNHGYYYLATDYCSGGTMLDRIISQGHFSERECADFMKDVLMAVKYMHINNNIVHRDIKCANLVFDKKGPNGILKIIDFGHTELITDKNEIDSLLIGSLNYLAPELLSAKKRTKGQLFKSDMWALGVVCYILLSGKTPFYGKNQAQILGNIKKGKFSWPKKVKLSGSCRDFVSSLLTLDINQRADVQTALSHEWILSKATDNWFGDAYLSQIQEFHHANKLQKILINTLLTEMNKNDKKILLKRIKELDMNGDGKINENDLINYILTNGSIDKPTQSAERRAKTILSQITHGLHQSDHQTYISNLDNIFTEYFGNTTDDDNDDDDNSIDINDIPSPTLAAKISVQKFKFIISKASKQYDADKLVKALGSTPSSNIYLKDISDYSFPLHSVNSTPVYSNQAHDDVKDMDNDDVDVISRAQTDPLH